MSEHVETHTERRRRTKESPAVPAAKPTFMPDVEAAAEAYKNCSVIAAQTVEASFKFDQSARTLAKAVYELVLAVIPEAMLANLRRPWGEEGLTDETMVSMPQVVLKFLRDHDLPRPPLRSNNPFLGWYQTFFVASAKKHVGMAMTAAEASGILADAADIKKLRADKAAESVMVSRYAKLVLAAVDMNDATVFEKPMRAVFDQYAVFVRNNPTLCGKPATPRGRPTAAKPPEATGVTEETEEDLDAAMREAAEYDPYADRVEEPAPGVEPVVEPEPEPEPVVTSKVEVPDSPAERALEADLTARTAAAAKPGDGTAAAAKHGDGIHLVQPAAPEPKLELSPAHVWAAMPPIQIDIDGRLRVISHRVAMAEPVIIHSDRLTAEAPDEGFLRYRKEGDQIIVLETLDWIE